MKTENYSFGREGEKIAIEFLKSNGYRILDSNYTTKFGEIDVIAMINNILVICEVKRRKANVHGYPREAVHRQKQHQIIRVTQSYIAFKKLYDKQVRFDVIEILGEQVNHIKNAFNV